MEQVIDRGVMPLCLKHDGAPPPQGRAHPHQKARPTHQQDARPTVKPTVSHMLGEVTWLMSQSPLHKHFTLGDLEWMVMPAILLEQFRVFRGEETPIGFALWAYLSEAAEQRLNEMALGAGVNGIDGAVSNARGGARLRPDEWNSGDRLWLVELVAPFATPDNNLTEAMVADLTQNVFRTETGEVQKFKMHVMDPLTGVREVKEIGV